MLKDLVCISCPIGCRIRVEWKDGEAEAAVISGNKCSRGRDYALAEITSPRRTVTATVATSFMEHPRLSVKTDAPFPKSEITALLSMLRDVRVENAVDLGDPVINDALGTGINLIATSRIAE